MMVQIVISRGISSLLALYIIFCQIKGCNKVSFGQLIYEFLHPWYGVTTTSLTYPSFLDTISINEVQDIVLDGMIPAQSMCLTFVFTEVI